jgi:hypothetical protein
MPSTAIDQERFDPIGVADMEQQPQSALWLAFS